jgi:sigma-B regulation protein RsbU (phosphoserine phosphatase)
MLPGESGTALGIFDEASFSVETMQLNAGESLIMYTDGINEAMNVSFEEYGEERLCDLLTGLEHYNAQELIEAVNADINVFTLGAEQSDDIALIAFQLKGK